MAKVKSIGTKKLGQIHIKQTSDCMTVNISFDKLAEKIDKAQRELDEQILEDMVSFMPMDTGNLMWETMAINDVGSGELILDPVNYARFLYHGKLMVYPPTGSSWAPRYETKAVTDIPLKYDKSHHADAGPEWFERAKEARKKTWLKVAREAVGKG